MKSRDCGSGFEGELKITAYSATPNVSMTDRDFWLTIRRALLMIVAAIVKHKLKIVSNDDALGEGDS